MATMRNNATRMLIGFACALCSPAQTPAPAPAFEVASIRISQTTLGDIMAGKSDGVHVQGTRVTFTWMLVESLVREAYGVQRALVILPKGAEPGPRYDIVATMPEGSTREQYPAMLRTLLAERFGLQAHRDQREFLTAVLTVGKNGHKLKRVPEGMPKSRKSSITRELSRMEITDDWDTFRPLIFAGAYTGQPFIDQTGLSGLYSGVLEIVRTPEFFAPDENGGYPALFKSMSVDTADRLGFKVTEQKLTLEAVVVDHLNPQPSEN